MSEEQFISDLEQIITLAKRNADRKEGVVLHGIIQLYLRAMGKGNNEVMLFLIEKLVEINSEIDNFQTIDSGLIVVDANTKYIQ